MAIPNMELTTSEKMLIAEWKLFEAQSGAPPSIRHLANKLQVYPNSIVQMIKRLKTKGYLVDKKVTATRLKLSAKALKVGP